MIDIFDPNYGFWFQFPPNSRPFGQQGWFRYEDSYCLFRNRGCVLSSLLGKGSELANAGIVAIYYAIIILNNNNVANSYELSISKRNDNEKDEKVGGILDCFEVRWSITVLPENTHTSEYLMLDNLRPLLDKKKIILKIFKIYSNIEWQIKKWGRMTEMGGWHGGRCEM